MMVSHLPLVGDQSPRPQTPPPVTTVARQDTIHTNVRNQRNQPWWLCRSNNCPLHSPANSCSWQEWSPSQYSTTAGFNFLNIARSAGVALNAGQESRIPKTWILLDNQSTVDVFHNDDLLENIRVSDNGYMDIHCNAGVTSTNLVGDLPGYGTVWFTQRALQIFYL